MVQKHQKRTMSDMSDAVTVAVITGCFGILVALVQKGRKENNRDHGIVAEKLSHIKSKIENVEADVMHIDMDLGVIESKIDGHINDHAHGTFEQTGNSRKKKKQ